jgi:hypothetical protein
VAGLTNLTELNLLSLGNNLIEHYNATGEVIDYLRSFPNKLEVLNLKGNKCEKENPTDY